MTTPSQTYYSAAARILAALGAVATPANLDLLVAWQVEEHGWESALSCHNPLNTTWRMPGSTDYNSDGVQCYPNWSSGISATVQTLTQANPSYSALVEALRHSSYYEFFQGDGYDQLVTWSGGDTSYPGRIAAIYLQLPAVPSVYLQAVPTSSGGGGPQTEVDTVRVEPNYWLVSGLFAVGIVLVVYAIESNRRAR